MRKVIAGLGVAIILASILGFAYPFVGQYINSITHAKTIAGYKEEVKTLSEIQAEELLAEAREYNEWIFSRGSVATLTDEETERYNGVLDMSVTGVMGYISIPKIDVELPIYHGTEEKVLQVGIGHLAGSSVPIGGTDTHTVLTGHSGLPSSKLFTDLDQLDVGDTFTITVLNNTVTYKVDGTEVVLPEDAEIQIGEGEDRCTLVTCTPIGANTHRLLVHAHRIANAEPVSGTEAKGETDFDSMQDTQDYRITAPLFDFDTLTVIVIVATIAASLATAFALANLVVENQYNRKEKPSDGKDK